ncbi:hypothetical protein SAMN05518866_14129 [Sphingobium sp. YR768]|nr:hypothetical protein SAMN05518866_14129 [Sphingobium sp. YR768]
MPASASANTEPTAHRPNSFIVAPNFNPASFETGSIGGNDELRAPIMMAGDNFLSEELGTVGPGQPS